MIRVLITGAKGSLGQAFTWWVQQHHVDWECITLDRQQFDLLWPTDQLHSTLSVLSPDIIVNCAAYNLVDKAEIDSDDAMTINGEAPGAMAQWVAQDPSRFMVHISSDYVFDGEKGSPYTVTDSVNPISIYGQTKLAGEMQVSMFAPSQSAVIRTSWLYGDRQQGFVWFVLNALKSGNSVAIADDQWGSPTWVGHLSAMIDSVLEERAAGLFHGNNTGCVSRLEQAYEIARLMGVHQAETLFEPKPTASFNLAAKRPRNSAMVSSFDEENALMDWKAGLETFLAMQGYQAAGV